MCVGQETAAKMAVENHISRFFLLVQFFGATRTGDWLLSLVTSDMTLCAWPTVDSQDVLFDLGAPVS